MNETVVCVGAVVCRANKVLLVRQSQGHSLGGQWTIPWGQLGRGESPSAAVVRETLEESGIVAEVEGLLGVQELPAPWEGMIGLLYLCCHIDGDPLADNRETDAARYFSIDEFEHFAGPVEPLTAWLIGKVFSNSHTLERPDGSNPFSPSIGYV